jgi:hypothetical protein
MTSNDIFVFCLSIFIALTFTSAGLYLSDELSPANQLYQLYHGEQVTYHSYHYGIYDNGSVNYAISGANYVMPYALTLPDLSIPVYWVIDHFQDASRVVPMIFWILFIAFMVMSKLENKKRLYAIGALCTIALAIVNIILYSPFSGNIEILAIILTNILLYGLFGMMVWKTINEIFEKVDYWFIWIVVLSCSSLLFWVGTLKDHMLVAALFMVILYSIIRLNKNGNDNYLIYLSVASALVIWTRPELSIIILPLSILFLLYKYRNINYLSEFLVYTGIALIPMFINNYIVTGSFLKFPFQAVENKMGGIHFSNDMYGVLVNEIPTYIIKNLSSITPSNIFGLLFLPANKGVGLVPILLVSIVGMLIYLIRYKNIKLTFEEKLLYSSSFAVILMYLFTSYLGFGMHTEQGMLPDMRYFSLIYAPLTIASLSLLTRTYNFDYKNMMKTYIIFIGVSLVTFAIIIALEFPINIFMNIFGFGVLILVSKVIIGAIRNNEIKQLGELIAILATVPAIWQIFISVTTNKMYIYPMFVPIIDFIKHLIFI